MDERLTEFFDRVSPEELDTLIGDLPLDEEIGRDVLEHIGAKVEAAVSRDRCRGCSRRRPRRRLRRAAAGCTAAVLAAALLLGNAAATQATGKGLLKTVAQWAQSAVRVEEPPIDGFGEDGTAEFSGRRVDITTHTLLVSEETEAAEYCVELSSLTFGEPRRGHQQTAPHAYLYLYVDGQTADFAELKEGERVVFEGRPGTCLLVVVSTVEATITGTVTRTAIGASQGREQP